MERNSSNNCSCIRILTTIFLLSSLILTRCSSAANTSTDQSALLSLKSKITSDPYNNIMQNWTLKSPVCEWAGITCGKRHQRVTILNISYMSLTGQIPPELGNLTFLVALNIKGNNFFGLIPSDLSRLRRLRFVSLSENSFEGEVPSWLASLPQLEFLHLGNNSFTSLDSLLGSFTNINNGSSSSKLSTLSAPFNRLQGKISESIGNLRSLRRLIMDGNQLSGVLPSSLANLTSLAVLSMHDNFIDGNLPEWIGSLRNLRSLNLQSNRLVGLIPSGIFNLSTLSILSLSQNDLTDTLPFDTCLRLPLLRELYLASNELYGEIPLNISSCSKLRVLDLSFNSISGEIPNALGELVELEFLAIGPNDLSGFVPESIYNITTLRMIQLAANKLSGDLPPTLGYFLPNLELLYLGSNGFGGGFPNYILNCSELVRLDLNDNNLAGPIPSSVGDYLRFLQDLNLQGNGFTSSELGFINSLTNCRYLKALSVSENPLNGIIPQSIGNLSSSLTGLYVFGCGIEGNIPDEIGNLTGLVTMDLGWNYLAGEIPTIFRNFQSIQRFSLEGNQLKGFIPNELCQLKSLGNMYLGSNQLDGPIPECLGNISSLREIYMDFNSLTSGIPSSLLGLNDLLNLSLSVNSLSGPLSPHIGNLKAAITINLSTNQFSGYIPNAFNGLDQLQYLDLANNNFQGPIPESVGSVVNLVSLDLSRNKLNGTIPKSMEGLQHLEYFNVSYNELSGEIPLDGPFRNFTSRSFMFNSALCGPSKFVASSCPESRRHKSKTTKILLPLLVSVGITTVVFFACLAYALIRYRRKTTHPIASDAPAMGQSMRFSYYELLHATENYSENNLLGKGSFGSVYKGVLRDGTAFAVKVFHIHFEHTLKSFEVECEALRNLRHRNIVKVLGSCANQDFKAIVLEYMQNGSLEKCLYSQNQSLDIMQRLNLMIDVASALEYLHYGYSTPVVHCDLKPGNILLDDDMVARVSDFGMTKFLNEGESMTHTRTLATLGYMAPEFGSEGIISTRCDVYSYGIMLLETFTGKRPSDEMFSGDATLGDWVTSSMPNGAIRVVDPCLIANEPNEKLLDCIISILELGLSCSAKSPGERMDMKDVTAQLIKIKSQLTTSLGETSKTARDC